MFYHLVTILLNCFPILLRRDQNVLVNETLGNYIMYP